MAMAMAARPNTGAHAPLPLLMTRVLTPWSALLPTAKRRRGLGTASVWQAALRHITGMEGIPCQRQTTAAELRREQRQAKDLSVCVFDVNISTPVRLKPLAPVEGRKRQVRHVDHLQRGAEVAVPQLALSQALQSRAVGVEAPD